MAEMTPRATVRSIASLLFIVDQPIVLVEMDVSSVTDFIDRSKSSILSFTIWFSSSGRTTSFSNMAIFSSIIILLFSSLLFFLAPLLCSGLANWAPLPVLL